MEVFSGIWDFFYQLLTNTGGTLDILVNHFGLWVYAILFLIIFCETGLVVTPFLPGDSLLFLAGAVAARADNELHLIWLIVILICAAILGDAVNYIIGHFFGKKLFSNPDSRIFKQSHLEKTNHFYEKHGGKTIIIARFVPIVRTFAPFVAGMGKMCYKRFALFNITGGIAWVLIFSIAGYLVGGTKIVQENLQYIVIGIIIVSIIPGVVEYFKIRAQSKRDKTNNSIE